MWPRILGVFVLVAAAQQCFAQGKLPTVDLAIDSTSGKYAISVDGNAWFSGDDIKLWSSGRELKVSDGTLKMNSSRTYVGSDEMGKFNVTEFSWDIEPNHLFVTRFRQYQEVAAIVFEQHFPDGAAATSSGNREGVSSVFPSIDVCDLGAASRRGVLAYDGDMVGDGNKVVEWGEKTNSLPSGINAGPLAVFAEDMSTTAVISSFSNFMAAQNYFSTKNARNGCGGTLELGMMGNVSSIPMGYTLEHIMTFKADGVNAAMLAWGDVLLSRYGKNRRDSRDTDFTANYLGYSTDNGAYYYYFTEDGKDYGETLRDVAKYAAAVGIPYRWVLLDSWWYYKGIGDGVKNWTAMPSIFPEGLDALYNSTGWMVQGHNRYWASDTTYARQNGGDWNFLIDSETNYALPLEQEFWDYLLGSSRLWGLRVYEQDWLDDEYDHVGALTSDATLARTWLMQMGEAASRNGMTIQYCMSHCRHIMQSVEIPSVTQARASGDYHQGCSDQWDVGTTSIFADALAVVPTKDNYWSTTLQPGNPKYAHCPQGEPWSRLNAAVSSFTAGPVAPSDAIGKSDAGLIMRCCASDGLLLKPDAPAKVTDSSLVHRAFPENGAAGQLWTTTATVSGKTYSYVLGIEMQSAYKLSAEELGYAAHTELVAVEANATTVPLAFPLTVPVSDKSSFTVHTVAPVDGSGWALLGEPDKWVSVSPQRFKSVSFTPDGVAARVHGVSGEYLTVRFRSPKGDIVSVNCEIAPERHGAVVYSDKRACAQL